MREDGAKLENIDRVVVGTTVILNTAVEGKMKDCASITIPGPGLNSKLARAGDFNISVDGYVDHRGRKVEDLDTEAIENFQDNLDDGVETFAVVGKFSCRNPELENKAAALIDGNFISKGHVVSS